MSNIVIALAFVAFGISLLAMNGRMSQLRIELQLTQDFFDRLADRVDIIEDSKELDELEARVIDLENMEVRITNIEDEREELNS